MIFFYSFKNTVTDLANSCATPLFRQPQGSQGCLEKQNHPLSSNLVVWCAKIEPKTKKSLKNLRIDKRIVKNDDILTSFLKFLGFGPNFSAPNYQIQTQWIILLLWTPLGTLGASKQWSYLYLKNISAVLWMLAPPGEKICLLQIEALYNLYYFTWIKSDIITFHSHNSIIFKEIHSLKL